MRGKWTSKPGSRNIVVTKHVPIVALKRATTLNVIVEDKNPVVRKNGLLLLNVEDCTSHSENKLDHLAAEEPGDDWEFTFFSVYNFLKA